MRWLAIAVACFMFSANSAIAEVVVKISKSSQRMAVSVDGAARYNWPVSTGRRGYGTPNGVYRPQRLERYWYSRLYHNAPMPHAIFFHHGYAIHGTTEVARLGFIASHGCVRLHPENAAKLFALVRSQMKNTRIAISDKPIAAPDAPRSAPLVSENESRPEPAVAAPAAVGIAGASLQKPHPARRAEKTRMRTSHFSRIARMDRSGFHW
jgi:hypothetical protein